MLDADGYAVYQGAFEVQESHRIHRADWIQLVYLGAPGLRMLATNDKPFHRAAQAILQGRYGNARVVLIDELLKRGGKYSLPPLAVGMGIYLPMSITLLIPVGAFLGWFYNRWAERCPNPAFAERLGVLMATGLIVGESLFGVAFAGIVAATRSDAPLAVVKDWPLAVPVGLALFATSIFYLYFKTRSDASKPIAAPDGPIVSEATYR